MILKHSCFQIYHVCQGSHGWPGLCNVFTVCQVGERLPCSIMESAAPPLHEAMNTRGMLSLVQGGLHFILALTTSGARTFFSSLRDIS